MSDQEDKESTEQTQEFLRNLEQSGFFQQISNLEESLKTISGDIKNLGETATRRLEETESLAAHIIAIEAILTALMKNSHVDIEDVRALIRDKTSALGEGGEGNQAVQNIAGDLIQKV